MSPNVGGLPGLAALNSMRKSPRRETAERCELCAAPIAADHSHLVEVADRRLVCACEPCVILFGNQAAARYRRVPRRVQHLADFHMTDLQWVGLDLPINLAFFLHSTPAGRVVALYPSPGGATESSVPADAWQALEEDNPTLRELEPDVEALLVNRVRDARDYIRVGVDRCYELVGVIRTHWRGLSGGPSVWAEIARFFAALKERASHA